MVYINTSWLLDACTSENHSSRVAFDFNHHLFPSVQSQTQNKLQRLAACGQVSASSQSMRFILSLRMNSSFITSRPVCEQLKVLVKLCTCTSPSEPLLACRQCDKHLNTMRWLINIYVFIITVLTIFPPFTSNVVCCPLNVYAVVDCIINSMDQDQSAPLEAA